MSSFPWGGSPSYPPHSRPQGMPAAGPPARMGTRPSAVQLIQQLLIPQSREAALLELSRQREEIEDLAPKLWYTQGVIAVLLQEVVAIYPALNPPSLTPHASNRVCNVLALFQCIASHKDTRSLFLSGACCLLGRLCTLGLRRVLLRRVLLSATPDLQCCSLSALQPASRFSCTRSLQP
jgi:cell differentiation family Rcd1-like protein